jgi:DNA-binding response OmpR family regulator
MRAVLRRTERTEIPQPGLRVGEVSLDPRARLATAAGVEIELTSAEFAMLECLLGNAGEPVSRDALGRAALGRNAAANLDRNVDTLISKLRRKLGAHDGIRTVRNVGYMFAVS